MKIAPEHIVLMGDSIFDNAAYVLNGIDVITNLRRKLPEGWRASLIARDGSMVNDVIDQIRQIPGDASFIVVSAGGNDALSHINILNETANSVAEVLLKLSIIQDGFISNYRKMLNSVLSCGIQTTVCTIYNPRFPDPYIQRLARVALSIFNDCMVAEALRARLRLIDLRDVCKEDTDYANPIEPSETGGKKIAEAIYNTVTNYHLSHFSN